MSRPQHELAVLRRHLDFVAIAGTAGIGPMGGALYHAGCLVAAEYEELLASVCPTPGGEPDRENIDELSRELAEQYEGVIRRLNEAFAAGGT